MALVVRVGANSILPSRFAFGLQAPIRRAAVATFVSCGPAPGASPASVARTTATMQAHGAPPRSRLAAPLAGAQFVDIADAAVLQGGVLGRGPA